MKKMHIAALVIVVATILGATVLREPIANAASSVSATIVGPLDAQGNVKTHEQGTANVAVTNAPASHPLEVSGVISLADGQVFGDQYPYTVPAGKRLVIEYLTAKAYVPTGSDQQVQIQLFDSTSRSAPQRVLTFLPVRDIPFDGGDFTNYFASEEVRGYVEAAHEIRVYYGRNRGAGGQALLFWTLSGYLVDA
jgi:hypothetical protein